MAHQRSGEGHEGRMDVDTARRSNRQSSERMQPRDRAFDDPPVAPKVLLAFDPAASDPLHDASFSE
jgi:hypothetical protein